MLLLPCPTPTLRAGDNLTEILMRGAMSFRVPTTVAIAEMGIAPSEARSVSRDIIVVSSKAIATVEGSMIDLRALVPSADARDLSRAMGRSAEFCQAMLGEVQRLNGQILGVVPGAALTEVRPEGMHGSIMVANAGLDESNAPEGCAIGWPKDPVASVARLRKELEQRREENPSAGSGGKWKMENSKNHFPLPTFHSARSAVILSDSVCMPRRNGVTAIALAVSGLDPLQSQKGKKDLFSKPLFITTEAVADQLATAANFLMGNAGQSVPAVIIRDHGLKLSDWEGWVPGIEPERDLFRAIL